MNEQEKTFSFRGEKVTIRVHTYQNNKRPAIQLLDAEGFPYAMATLNVPSNEVDPEMAVIKDYSENKGIYPFLLTHNIVRSASDFHVLPHGEAAPICIINPPEDWMEANQERDPEWFKDSWDEYMQAD